MGEKDPGTSLGLLVFGEEFHGGTLEGRGHFVCIFELIARPVPDLLHIVGHVIRVEGAILGHCCRHIGLELRRTVNVSLWRAMERVPYRERQDAAQHLHGHKALEAVSEG